nr:MAG TPA: hypothetical protein [Caudoviricetes sp.]
MRADRLTGDRHGKRRESWTSTKPPAASVKRPRASWRRTQLRRSSDGSSKPLSPSSRSS